MIYLLNREKFVVEEMKEIPDEFRFFNDPEETLDYNYMREELLKLGSYFFEVKEGEKITLEEIFEDYDVEDLRKDYLRLFHVPKNMLDLMDYCTDDALKAFIANQIKQFVLQFDDKIFSGYNGSVVR
jgi:hypothetical protein